MVRESTKIKAGQAVVIAFRGHAAHPVRALVGTVHQVEVAIDAQPAFVVEVEVAVDELAAILHLLEDEFLGLDAINPLRFRAQLVAHHVAGDSIDGDDAGRFAAGEAHLVLVRGADEIRHAVIIDFRLEIGQAHRGLARQVGVALDVVTKIGRQQVAQLERLAIEFHHQLHVRRVVRGDGQVAGRAAVGKPLEETAMLEKSHPHQLVAHQLFYRPAHPHLRPKRGDFGQSLLHRLQGHVLRHQRRLVDIDRRQGVVEIGLVFRAQHLVIGVRTDDRRTDQEHHRAEQHGQRRVCRHQSHPPGKRHRRSRRHQQHHIDPGKIERQGRDLEVEQGRQQQGREDQSDHA